MLGLTYFAVTGFFHVAAVALLGLRAWRALGPVLALNAGVQVLDTVWGLVRADVVATVGPALISMALIAAVIVLLRRPAAVEQPAGS